jgi:hypothetical protein
MELAGKYANNLKSTGYEPGSDPRDFLLEPNFWASQTLPLGVSIDQAIQDGFWPKMLGYKK